MAVLVDSKHDVLIVEATNAGPLGRLRILGYGAGHMLNDITSACWFTYLLLFLTDLGLNPRDAAIVMLSGQVADAFTTIFAGELIDRFGHFKLWHAGGSILVAISFSSVFGGCLPCKVFGSNSFTLQTIGYSLFAAIFNVGWAVTQVSHMSMVNCITLNPTTRVSLTSCRNAFTMVANLSLYAVALVVFNKYNAKAYADIKLEYRWIAYLSIFVGCCFVAVFLIGTKEPEHFLHSMLSMIWECLNPQRLWYLPSSTLAVSLYQSFFSWSGSRLNAYFTSGAILWMLSGSAIFVLPSSLHNIMYFLSITIGIANALMMVTGISMQSMLVGKNLNGCGFVYGSLSFVDKLSCGLALYALESYQGSTRVVRSLAVTGSLSVTRCGLGLIPAACALVAALVTNTMKLEETRSKQLSEPLLV